ncbi:hypothetical protein ERICI_03761 [Paenibacillus larvae subsp. larvae]|uniref:Uncharacterized protein n=1 Tax=Paenibacillus larvae subsp. larvae TaxID=147375 RepID=A0A6C0QNH9_9BACL|nr:hypothetical protein ERICI_03761 [Paenibacillus larvae subsp. larvae]QHZ50120.1 hypothetical protein ERICV_00945 [Paenibacillus larvae subsp. larvae]
MITCIATRPSVVFLFCFYSIIIYNIHRSYFIVRSSTGKSKANTIIGNPPLGVKEYVLTIEQGDTSECHASFKFIPIE